MEEIKKASEEVAEILYENTVELLEKLAEKMNLYVSPEKDIFSEIEKHKYKIQIAGPMGVLSEGMVIFVGIEDVETEKLVEFASLEAKISEAGHLLVTGQHEDLDLMNEILSIGGEL